MHIYRLLSLPQHACKLTCDSNISQRRAGRRRPHKPPSIWYSHRGASYRADPKQPGRSRRRHVPARRARPHRLERHAPAVRVLAHGTSAPRYRRRRVLRLTAPSLGLYCRSSTTTTTTPSREKTGPVRARRGTCPAKTSEGGCSLQVVFAPTDRTASNPRSREKADRTRAANISAFLCFFVPLLPLGAVLHRLSPSTMEALRAMRRASQHGDSPLGLPMTPPAPGVERVVGSCPLSPGGRQGGS